MISEHAVRAAEQAVAARKATIAHQWRALQARSVEAATRPSTLAGLALAGAVVGWRAGGRDIEQTQSKAARCDCEDKERPAGDGGMGIIKSAVVGVLRGLAAMATEELIRGFVPSDDESAPSPEQDLHGTA